MPEPRETDVEVLGADEAPEEIEVVGKEDLGGGHVVVTTQPKRPEAKPVPKGTGGSFVKRGGKLYPRGS